MILFLGILSGVIQLVGYIFYVRKARHNDIDPNPVTWLIFAFDTALLTFLEFVADASVSILILPVLCSIGAIYVALLLYENGKMKWPVDVFDRYILSVGIAIAFIYTVLFALEHFNLISPTYVLFATYGFLLLSNLNTFVAFVPIIREVRAFPEKEHAGPWTIWTIAYGLLFLVTWLEVGTDSQYAILYLYPLSSCFLHGTIAFLARDNNNKKLRSLYTKESKINGMGLYTKPARLGGMKIADVVGIEKKFISNNSEEAVSIKTWYGVTADTWIDPGDSVFQFLNHSCNPNCAIVGKRTLIARRPISAHEELSIDYSMTDADMNWVLEYECNCGSSNCRKEIKSIQMLDEETVRAHLPYIPRFFLQVYNEAHPSAKLE